MPKSCVLSLRKLGLPSNTVSVFPIANAPEVLQDVDLSGEGSHVFVIPDRCATLLRVHSIYSEKIKGGTVYVA